MTPARWSQRSKADDDHERCARFLAQNWTRLVVPSLAVTEVCHLLADPQRRGSHELAARFCAAIGADELRVIEVTPHDYQRMSELLTSYASIAEAKRLDAVLDLVGNSTILDSLAMLRRGGRACLAGWLGGLDPIPDFNPLLQMASGVYLTFFGSFVFGTPGFPLSDVPLQTIAEQVAAGRLRAKPSRVFRFEEVREAHRVMEANEAKGKMVVVNT